MRTLKAFLTVLPLVIVTAGCSSTSSDAPAQPSTGNRFKNMLFLGTANPAPAPAVNAPAVSVNCPAIEILPGTAAYVVGDHNDAFNVRYQASMGELARECTVVGDTQVALKVGVSGRLMVGPKGQSGTSIAIPVRIAVLNADGKAVSSRLARLNVAIPSGEGGADFIHVEEMGSLPLDETALRNWKIVVGFDGGTKARR